MPVFFFPSSLVLTLAAIWDQEVESHTHKVTALQVEATWVSLPWPSNFQAFHMIKKTNSLSNLHFYLGTSAICSRTLIQVIKTSVKSHSSAVAPTLFVYLAFMVVTK